MWNHQQFDLRKIPRGRSQEQNCQLKISTTTNFQNNQRPQFHKRKIISTNFNGSNSSSISESMSTTKRWCESNEITA
jgi:hypothetical protein